MYPGTHVETMAEKPAVVMAGSGRTVTYGELNDESIRFAKVLRSAGLERGDRIAILMDNDPRYLTVCWAAQRSGLVYVPVNWHLTAGEMQYIVDNSGARALVVNAACAAPALDLRGSASVRVGLAVGGHVDGYEDFDGAIASQSGDVLEDEIEGADMIYSSGTTGFPKGGARPLSDRHPADFPQDGLDRFFGRFGFDRNSRYLTPGAPMYHAAPLRFSMAVTRFGGTNVIMERFDPADALAAIERDEVTHSQWVPTMFVRLLRLPEEVRDRFDLSSHRTAIHAAAPCPVAVKEQMMAWWGPIVHEYYGGSEGGAISYISAAEAVDHRGSVGRAIVGSFHIVDESGAEQPPGEPGIIYSEQGAPVSYFNDPEKTKAAHDPRGWVTIGDMGYLDDEGYLYLTDRKDHMIIAGGVNIYPQESENILIRHPHVADVAVIGVPNDEFGEEVKAVVQLVDPAIASSELADELIELCRRELASYKCPRSVDFEAELPRAPSGKLYKRRLRDRYWAGHASQVI
jgi:long-chain acyl-CoA synthetase